MNSIVKYQAAIALLVTILSNFSDSEYCPASAPTVSVVSKCPTTKTEWDQAASRKKCSHMSAKCGDKTPVYHCLLNQWRNETVEVCSSTWYISGFCAVYNTDEMKVIDDFERDCTNFSEGKCPTRYISSEAYLYQKCYMQKSSNKIPLPDRSIRTEETNDCILSTIIAIVVTVLVLVIITLVVFITLRLKISKKAQDEECMPFCNATKQKVGKKEEGTPLMENENIVENEDIAMNPTKESAKLVSFEDAAASNQMPDTQPIESPTEGNGVDNTRPGSFYELKSRFEATTSPGPNSSEREIKKPNTKAADLAADKENAVQKDHSLKAAHNTDNNVDCTSHGNLKNEEGNDEDHSLKAAHNTDNNVDCTSHGNLKNEEGKDEDHSLKAAHNTDNNVDCTSHGNLTNEEGNDEDPIADTESTIQNEVKQKMDYTLKEDVDFSSHESHIDEENNGEEKTQPPDLTPSKSATNITNEKSTDSVAGKEKPLQDKGQKADDTDARAFSVRNAAKKYESQLGK